MYTQRILLIVVVLVLITLTVDTSARSQDRAQNDNFVYVGLSTTVCRIEPDSGRLWVLKNTDERRTLQGVPDAAGWHWQPVNLSAPAPQTTTPRKTTPADQPPQ